MLNIKNHKIRSTWIMLGIFYLIFYFRIILFTMITWITTITVALQRQITHTYLYQQITSMPVALGQQISLFIGGVIIIGILVSWTIDGPSNEEFNNFRRDTNGTLLGADTTSQKIELLKSKFSKYSRLIEKLDAFHKKMLKKGSRTSYTVIIILILESVICNLFIFVNSDSNNNTALVSIFTLIVTVALGGIYKIIDNRSNQSKTLFDTKKEYLDKLIEIDFKLQTIELKNGRSTYFDLSQRQKRIDDLIETIAE